MRAPVVLFLLAAVAAVGVILIAANGETSPLIWIVMAAGAGVSLAGGAYGRPPLLYAGAVAQLGGFGFTLSTGSSNAIDALLVAILLWLQVELQARSMELRPAVAPTGTATLSWVAIVVGVSAASLLIWMVIGAIEVGAPDGGLLYRVLAVAAVVAVAVLISGVPWRRREAQLPGSDATRQ